MSTTPNRRNPSFMQYLRQALLTHGPLLLVVLFLMVSANVSLFNHILEIYPLTLHNLGFLISLACFFTTLTFMMFVCMTYGKATRWILALFVLLASQGAYYMDQFGVIIDTVMIENVVQTNPQEAMGLISTNLILRTIFLGLIPAWLILKFYPTKSKQLPTFKDKCWMLILSTLTLVMLILPCISGYFSFIREHQITRFYANPTYMTYSLMKYLSAEVTATQRIVVKNMAEDSKLLEPPTELPELMIMVVGETARADRFSLNGYQKETNPLLKKQGVISFSNVTSCGTSTSISVPCMFSSLTRKTFSKEKGLAQENVLDILFKNGVAVLWRDNNSDSKGVALRVPYENFKTPTLNPVCEGECRDIGMLNGLEEYIQARNGKDILIVLHQMGNHGPEYYRRYPKEFEKFKPMCKTGELRDCTKEEVDNSYDNAILYTDYFLSQVIDLLKQYDDTHSTAMLYVADHGESLGEHGFYLHAAPYAVAPEAQTHVPAMLWTGHHFDYAKDQVNAWQDMPLSHDDVFCTLLLAFEVATESCHAQKNVLLKKLGQTIK